ncbi:MULTISPECIES: lecithin retinol acyltransferase family protein [Aliivibrio]|uniref:LRAT domain-containing protein n=1 Tax=Aliivibrio sifiae TaxID=566293 RepID=A0A2S7X2I8_9GAMM|nr:MULTISPECIES: lecithin retinol acyltransferase family protein [Aliivibrio]MBB1315762.1 lecithin retinol acyltransferase family protein [Aliivibrio sp. SR45-2]MUK32187.1 hypothetical protein [Aliivibrio fischeri]PQJ84444.1 hypothetical protein BTO22_12975 [Aliivibrio sifiae]
MKTISVKPGDVLVSDFGVYQHWSIVTDKVCTKGTPLLISATQRNGTVQEEPWHDVTQGKKTYVTNAKFSKPISEVLSDARSQIGLWPYSVTSKNCEHFVKWATGLKVTSTQVTAGVVGAGAGIALVGLCSENPKFAKFLGWSILLGGLAVLGAKAVEKVD